jgi:predicted nucleic acid-binding protein
MVRIARRYLTRREAEFARSTTPPSFCPRALAHRAELDSWLATRPTLPYIDDVARLWGEISANATRRGRPRPQNATWIAACCLAYELPLVTLNVKDFKDFAKREGLTLLSI